MTEIIDFETRKALSVSNPAEETRNITQIADQALKELYTEAENCIHRAQVLECEAAKLREKANDIMYDISNAALSILTMKEE